MRGLPLGSAFAALIIGTVAWASTDAIATRKAVMKEYGASMGALAKMAKGEAPFDADAAHLALRTLYERSADIPALFPAGTESGGDTEAGPAIWSNPSGFAEKAEAMNAAAATLIATPIENVDGVRAAIGALGPTCQGCHEGFRVKKS